MSFQSTPDRNCSDGKGLAWKSFVCHPSLIASQGSKSSNYPGISIGAKQFKHSHACVNARAWKGVCVRNLKGRTNGNRQPSFINSTTGQVTESYATRWAGATSSLGNLWPVELGQWASVPKNVGLEHSWKMKLRMRLQRGINFKLLAPKKMQNTAKHSNPRALKGEIERELTRLLAEKRFCKKK